MTNTIDSFAADEDTAVAAVPTVSARGSAEPIAIATVEIWGLPLARVTFGETLALVDRLIDRRQPSFFITANLHYAMLTEADPRLKDVNRRAAFLVADGMPMVWYSRLTRRPLPERVTGADLIGGLCGRAAEKGHRVFLLGAAAGVARQAADILTARYPGLQIVGTLSPPFGPWTPEVSRAMIGEVRRARPDVLIVAAGQPKGELWMDQYCEALGVPACVQVGASLDFVVGRQRRAPRWLQRIGLEWFYRLSTEPRRLVGRYTRNGLFLLKALLKDALAVIRCPNPRSPTPSP